jgi:hypothetical protein
MTADSDKDRQLSEIRSDIEATRERLAQTLDAIEERLDVPKRVKEMLGDVTDRSKALGGDFQQRFDCLREDNPAVLYAVLGGAAAVLTGVGLLVVRSARR